MPRQGRPIRLQIWLLAALLLSLGHAPRSVWSAEPERSPPEWLADAELNDICFLDPDRGWAVGDRGAIWRTDDGGRHWRLDESPVTCRLESLSVVGGQAFAVGGWIHPHTFRTSGVVLRTREENRRWENLKTASLPGLKQVKFLDARTGWALGNSSALYPAGIFKSTDGGRSWASIPHGQGSRWQTGDFRDSKVGVLANRENALSHLAPAGIRTARSPELGTRNIHRVRLWGPLAGWLVGDGGLALTTTDGGHTWQAPAAPLPGGVSEQFDLRALAVYDKHVWMAGSPGTRVFHSGDGGKTWDQFPTEQALPLGSLMFLDEHRGWAVGALGTILATTDGGRTWRRQHGGGTRAAVVGFFGEGQSTPLELFARLSGDEGYLSAIEVIGRHPRDESEAHESTASERARDALVSLGASSSNTAWRFPLAQSGLKLPIGKVVAGFDRASAEQGLARLEEHVVKKIRQWRPEVVVTGAGGARGAPLSRVIYQAVLSASDRAGDPTAYPEHSTLGLTSWKVKKICCALPDGERAALTLNTAQLAPRLGRSLSDQASHARGLLHREYLAGPASIAFQIPYNRLTAELGERDFVSGVSLPPGGEARRPVGQAAAGTLDALQRAAQRQRNVRQLLARSVGERGSGAAWLAQIEQLTEGLSPTSAGEILFQLALNYHESGQGDLAAETFELLAERQPDHALTESALIWLVQYYASSEAAHRRGLRLVSAAPTLNSMRPHDPELPTKPVGPQLGDTSAFAKKAAVFARRIEQSRPALYAEPLVRFPLAVSQRIGGDRRGAETFFQSLAETRAHDSWWACASGELWLAKPGPVCPKGICRCVASATRPRLDGRLDDVVWKSAKPVDLKSALDDDERWPAQAMLAHDKEFLYLAVRCFKAPGVEYVATKDGRPRDAELQDYDRVDLLLDLDRDYSTYYRFTVDHRGWTSEACLGDKTWNPTWFVAAGGDEFEWTMEVAIPLTELTSRAITPRDGWAIGLQRTVPTAGFQSFTQPAAIAPRGEGFGLLIFE